VEKWRKKNRVEDEIGGGTGRESKRTEGGRDGVETTERRRVKGEERREE